MASVAFARGIEGAAARLVFPLLNRRTAAPGFESKGRVPRAKPDRWNTLLDALYSLLFTRLNVLLRCANLDPYLGFLHSPKDDYESLVCDLIEPFRFRMDRLASPDLQLLVHRIPAHIAADIHIETPPVLREDCAIKFFATVPSLADAGTTAASHGGQLFDESNNAFTISTNFLASCFVLSNSFGLGGQNACVVMRKV